MKLFNIQILAKNIIINGKTHSFVSLYLYIKRTVFQEFNYEALLSKTSFQYHTAQQSKGFMSEEALYAQEKFTLEEVEIYMPKLCRYGTVEVEELILPIHNKLPLSVVHVNHYNETFSMTIRVGINEIVLFGYC